MVDRNKLRIEIEDEQVEINPADIDALIERYPDILEPDGKNWITEKLMGGCITKETLEKAKLILSTRERSATIAELKEEGALFLVSENLVESVNFEDISKMRDEIEIIIDPGKDGISIGDESSCEFGPGSKYWTIDSI